MISSLFFFTLGEGVEISLYRYLMWVYNLNGIMKISKMCNIIFIDKGL